MKRAELSVVIPSWNGKDILRGHLPSVLDEAQRLGSEVVVVDDGSEDESAAMLAREFPEVRVVRRERSGGFSRAASQAAARAHGRIVVLLNNDMELRSGALEALAEALERDPGVFAAVPSIVRTATGEEEARTRLRFRHGVVSTSLDAAPGSDPAYACGGAMAFRREEFLLLGGFDPLFSPFYWEDVDLSYRARKRGRRIAHVASARVDHDHGRTIGARFARREVETIYERNRLLFTWKNLTDPPLWRAHLLALPAKVVWDLVAHPGFLRGLARALALRGALATSRRLEKREALVPDRELLRS